jgi:hypothetical protein
MDSLQTFILSAGELALIGYACLLFWCVVFNRENTSVMIALPVWVAFDFLSLAISPLIYAQMIDQKIDRLAWYVIFISIHALAIFCVFFSHRALKVEFSNVAHLVVGMHFVMMCMALVMHFALLMGSSRLDTAYHFAIPALKLFAVFLLTQSCLRVKGVISD